MNESEKRVKEVHPNAFIDEGLGCLLYGVYNKPIARIYLGGGMTEAEAWADAASRLPKAEATPSPTLDFEFAINLIMQWSISTNADHDSDLRQAVKILRALQKPTAPPVAEPAPQTFEWMLSAAQEINRIQLNRDHVIKDSFGLKHPIMPVDEQVAIMKKHWNAAKASSPVKIRKFMSSGGITGINDYEMSDGSIQAIRASEIKEDDWEPASSPAVAGGESENEEEE